MVVERISRQETECIILDALNNHYEDYFLPVFMKLSPEKKQHFMYRYGMSDEGSQKSILKSIEETEQYLRENARNSVEKMVIELFPAVAREEEKFARVLDRYKSKENRVFLCTDDERRKMTLEDYIVRLKNEYGFMQLDVCNGSLMYEDDFEKKLFTEWYLKVSRNQNELIFPYVSKLGYVREVNANKIMVKVNPVDSGCKNVFYIECDMQYDEEKDSYRYVVTDFLYKN